MKKYAWRTALITTVASALIFAGCQKEANEVAPPKPAVAEPTVRNTGTIDPNLETIAKSLAISLAEKDVKQFIKQEALKEFDEDYDILYSQVKDKIIGNLSFEKSLTTSLARFTANKGGRISADEAARKIATIQHDIPLLNISVPVNIDSWDTENYTPLVAIRPNHSSGEFTHIKAYDHNGNVHWLDALEEPTVPVVVVGLNERVIINQNNELVVRYYKSEAAVQAGCPNCRIAPNEGGGGGGGGGGRTGSTSATCDRNTKNTKDELNKIKFSSIQNLRKAEHWLDGAVDLRCLIVLGGATPEQFQMLNKYNTLKRPDLKTCDSFGFNCWTVWSDKMRGEVVNWDPAVYGDKMLYKWFEEEGGGSTKSTASLSTSFKDPNNPNAPTYTITNAVEFTRNLEDKPLSEAFVNYCDAANGEGYTYGGGQALLFTVRQQ